MKRLIDLFVLSSFAMLCLIVLPETVYAVPPPDFLFNLGGSLVQVFSVVVLFLSAIFSISYKYIKTKVITMKSNRLGFLIVSVIAIIGISVGAAFLYGNYKQDAEYNEWIAESEKYSQLAGEQEEYLENAKIARPLIEKGDKVDRLRIGATPSVEKGDIASDAKFISTTSSSDRNSSIRFIEDYYRSIAMQDLDTAYSMSKKSVGLETFKSWYVNTTKITLDNFTSIDGGTSSVELTLYEGDTYTRYGVLISLKFQGIEPIQITGSTVRILSQGKLIEKGDTLIAEKGDQPDTLYSQNQNDGISISNEELQEIINSGRTDYIILDAREDLEYENGYLEGSTHVRFADLQAGKWIELSEDKYIYVLCWSGIRGKEVAEFLRTKNLLASYLENGANGWVEWGGAWVGNIKFTQKYAEAKYKKIFTTNEVKSKVADGVVLVDSREPEKFNNWHIEGSVNIAMMHTPTSDIIDAFAQVPAGSMIITICDGYVNCFDAKITAVELEERGHTFIGRYNKPWEFE